MGAGRGFRVDEQGSPLLMEVVHTSVRRPGNGRSGSSQQGPTDWRYNAGLFDGMLVCTDADRMRDAVVNGVGHGRAYGFGLLSVVPVSGDGHDARSSP